jgi:hypothetical protein
MMDGLKTTQRKVLFAAMENLKEKKRVSSELEFSRDIRKEFGIYEKFMRKEFGLKIYA